MAGHLNLRERCLHSGLWNETGDTSSVTGSQDTERRPVNTSHHRGDLQGNTGDVCSDTTNCCCRKHVHNITDYIPFNNRLSEWSDSLGSCRDTLVYGGSPFKLKSI